MITKDLKISRLLKEYPQSLDILLKSSPHFSKLQNKLLRKALAGRVTVEQAASIAGVDLTKLLSELNNPNGSVQTENDMDFAGNSAVPKPENLKSVKESSFIYLDVRPILDSGNDPLQKILSKISLLKNGEVLVIINSFEPVPLYTLLGKKGFSHWTEKENDHFNVYFYRDKNVRGTQTSTELPSPSIIEENYENIIELDVHELQPPEPMMKILENLTRINENTLLRIYHHREPHLLYPKLEERGYFAQCEKLGEDNFKILIAKIQD